MTFDISASKQGTISHPLGCSYMSCYGQVVMDLVMVTATAVTVGQVLLVLLVVRAVVAALVLVCQWGYHWAS